jgi:hypothetical protein
MMIRRNDNQVMGSRRGDSPLLLFQAGLTSTLLDLGFLVIQLSTIPYQAFLPR